MLRFGLGFRLRLMLRLRLGLRFGGSELGLAKVRVEVEALEILFRSGGWVGCLKKTKVVIIISVTILSHSIPVGELPKKI